MVAERVICPRCGRSVAGRTPKGGDGSALRLYLHDANGLGQCSASLKVFSDLEAFDVDGTR